MSLALQSASAVARVNGRKGRTTPRAPVAPPANELLAALPPGEFSRVRLNLEPVAFTHKMEIISPSEPLSHVYFPSRGVLSVLVMLQSGKALEIAVIGKEGFAGVQALWPDAGMPFQVICQAPGDGMKMKLQAFQREIKRGGAFAEAVRGHVEGFLMQVSLAAACNRFHDVEQRCARWLLMTQDRADGSDFFPITQEFLAKMLGIRRAGVNAVAASLKKQGVILYRRGNVKVVNRKRLESLACECYRAIRHTDERAPESPAAAGPATS